jgi:hypothetical protein
MVATRTIAHSVLAPWTGPPTKTPALVAQSYTSQAGDLGYVLSTASGYAHATVLLMSAVTAGDGAIQYVRKSDSVAQAVTGAANNGGGLIRLAVADTSKYVTNQVYTVNNVAGCIEANGTWAVTVIDGTHIDLQGSAFVNAYVSGGTINNARVTVNDGSSDRAWLTAQNDIAAFRSNGATWEPCGYQIAPLVQWWSANGTWTNPPLSSRLNLHGVGGGGGGGSGRRGATGSVRTAGSGGIGGVYANLTINTSDLAATEPVTIGAGGTGGLAVAVDSTPGNAGNGGATTTFGASFLGSNTWLAARGGNGGNPGTTSSVATIVFSTLTFSNWAAPGSGGGSSSTGTAIGGSTSAGESGGGGGGGSADASNVQRLPAAGGGAGAGVHNGTGSIPGGAAGTAGNPGGNGTNNSGSEFPGGAGGGGGIFVSATIGTAGGNGGLPAGGGGGGAASDNTFNSGAGGNGGRGELRAVTLF